MDWRNGLSTVAPALILCLGAMTCPMRESRAAEALDARVQAFLDRHVGDWHDLNVPASDGRILHDFVFSDADKDWYINYFDAVYPKLTEDACVTAHNVHGRRRGWQADYLEHVRAIADMTTRLHPDARAGIAITCKR
jgi:caffeoyl-CoA O-methyltransferase